MTTSQIGLPRPVTPTSILARRLDELARDLERVEGIDAASRAELAEICALARGLDPYLSAWSTPESAALAEVTLRTQGEDWSRHSSENATGMLEQEMLSGHVEGQFLKMLVHATRARRVLEIGPFTGYSALAMAEALPADGQVIACEIDAEVAAFAEQCLGQSKSASKIAVVVGPALQTLNQLGAEGEPFDLIFIDADKGGYLDYLNLILASGLLTADGLICVDNTLMQGQPWTPGPQTPNGVAIATFNRAVAVDPRIEQVIVPLRDGLTLIRRVEAV